MWAYYRSAHLGPILMPPLIFFFYFSCIIVHVRGEKESLDYDMVGRMRKLINIHFLVIKLVILDANGSIR